MAGVISIVRFRKMQRAAAFAAALFIVDSNSGSRHQSVRTSSSIS
jgi:hypothetical protein